MFGLFKKREPEPSVIKAKRHQFQTFFATRWVQETLAYSVGGFSGALLCGDSDKVIVNGWTKMWASNFPNDLMFSPDGLSMKPFHERGYLVGFIKFPEPLDAGGVYFGAAVIGPCKDPQWTPEARKGLPYRYFILIRANGGTTVEEWTTGSPVSHGAGPEPQSQLFAEWVVGCAIRSAGDATVTVRTSNEAVAKAIERARRELPAVLQRFIAGELEGMLFTVKVPITDGQTTEHFWLTDTTYSDGRFSGIIEADVDSVSTVKRGDRWTASVEEVTDWMYKKDQKMFGNYTLRALLPNLPPNQAAKFRAILSEEKE